MADQTLGEHRVRVSFNPSDNPDVDEIKVSTAHLIDWCEQYKKDPEQARCAALAQTYYETAAMYAVKAATTKPQEPTS